MFKPGSNAVQIGLDGYMQVLVRRPSVVWLLGSTLHNQGLSAFGLVFCHQALPTTLDSTHQLHRRNVEKIPAQLWHDHQRACALYWLASLPLIFCAVDNTEKNFPIDLSFDSLIFISCVQHSEERMRQASGSVKVYPVGIPLGQTTCCQVLEYIFVQLIMNSESLSPVTLLLLVWFLFLVFNA